MGTVACRGEAFVYADGFRIKEAIIIGLVGKSEAVLLAGRKHRVPVLIHLKS